MEGISEKGSRPITVKFCSYKKLRKDAEDGSPNTIAPEVLRIGKINGLINFNYTSSVNKRRKKEDKKENFQAQKSWHKNEGKATVSSEGGKDYVKIKVEKRFEDVFLSDNGEVIPSELVTPFITKRKNKKQDLDKPVEIRIIDMDNVREVTCENETFLIQ